MGLSAVRGITDVKGATWQVLSLIPSTRAFPPRNFSASRVRCAVVIKYSLEALEANFGSTFDYQPSLSSSLTLPQCGRKN